MMHDKMNNFRHLYIILVFLSVSCVRPKSNVSAVNTISYPAHTSTATTGDRIYFINFGCKLVNNLDSCFVINTIEVDGKLNTGSTNEPPHDSPGSNYICKVYDSADKLIYEEELVNPLHHRVDLFSENGKIESKDLTLQEAEFSIRFQQKETKACTVIVTKQAGTSSVMILKSNLK